MFLFTLDRRSFLFALTPVFFIFLFLEMHILYLTGLGDVFLDFQWMFKFYLIVLSFLFFYSVIDRYPQLIEKIFFIVKFSFIVLALNSVTETIDRTVIPWEKRGYWLKADRFRYEWSWTESYSAKMQQALISDDWQAVAETAALIFNKLQDEKIPARNRLGESWKGAWNKLQVHLTKDHN